MRSCNDTSFQLIDSRFNFKDSNHNNIYYSRFNSISRVELYLVYFVIITLK